MNFLKLSLPMALALSISFLAHAAKPKAVKGKPVSALETQFAALAAEAGTFQATCDAFRKELDQVTGYEQSAFTAFKDEKSALAALDQLEKVPQASATLRAAPQLFLDNETEVMKWKETDLAWEVLKTTCPPSRIFTVTSTLIDHVKPLKLSRSNAERVKMVVIDTIRANLAIPAASVHLRTAVSELEALESEEIVFLKRPQKDQLVEMKLAIMDAQKKLDKEYDRVLADDKKGLAQTAKELRDLTPLRLKIRDFATAL